MNTLLRRLRGTSPGSRLPQEPEPEVAPDEPVLVVCTGDLHVGSTVALCPPRVELDDGGVYEASPIQAWYWDCWQRFWDDTGELAHKLGVKVFAIFGGDEREGDHHNTTQIWCKTTHDQDQAVLQTLSVAGEVLDGAAFIRGTPAHDGPASAATEVYAKALAREGWRVARDGARFSWWHYLAVHSGVRIDAAHAPGTKSWVPHTTDQAAARHAQYTWEDYRKDGLEPPHVVLRFHVHQKAMGFYQDTACFFTPAWQLPTQWVLSRGVKSPRIERPGGLRLLCDSGEWRHFWLTFRPRSNVPWA